jgi:hypothetical protein
MRFRSLLAVGATTLCLAASGLASAQQVSRDGAYIRDCLLAAARLHREPAALLVILLNVEGGRLGAVTPNTNGTVDIGPMQVNDIWVPKVAAHWRTDKAAAYAALRDNFCANVEAGAWILRIGLDEARGDLWGGVAYYHSHNPDHQYRYLKSVLEHALKLRGQVNQTAAQPNRPPVAVNQVQAMRGG